MPRPHLHFLRLKLEHSALIGLGEAQAERVFKSSPGDTKKQAMLGTSVPYDLLVL